MSNGNKTEPPKKMPEPPPKPTLKPPGAPGGNPGPPVPSRQQSAQKFVEQQKQNPAPPAKKDVLRQDRGTLSKEFNRKV